MRVNYSPIGVATEKKSRITSQWNWLCKVSTIISNTPSENMPNSRYKKSKFWRSNKNSSKSIAFDNVPNSSYNGGIYFEGIGGNCSKKIGSCGGGGATKEAQHPRGGCPTLRRTGSSLHARPVLYNRRNCCILDTVSALLLLCIYVSACVLAFHEVEGAQLEAINSECSSSTFVFPSIIMFLRNAHANIAFVCTNRQRAICVWAMQFGSVLMAILI